MASSQYARWTSRFDAYCFDQNAFSHVVSFQRAHLELPDLKHHGARSELSTYACWTSRFEASFCGRNAFSCAMSFQYAHWTSRLAASFFGRNACRAWWAFATYVQPASVECQFLVEMLCGKLSLYMLSQQMCSIIFWSKCLSPVASFPYARSTSKCLASVFGQSDFLCAMSFPYTRWTNRR